ncbi:UNVERIFIED_CONTAM: protein TRANSPARENT TESTA GLABRA 1 [Sesamum radiatum]|uniref:Protein TRANSPARENT TESTA GLABRA 1 n=1 Tax=Sesamum radiatum TaxID=300843 RepID=A0AAW2KDG9_SESRA
MDNATQESQPRPENVVTFDSPYQIYAMAISAANRRRIAVGSFIEELNNRVDILSFSEDSSSLNPIPSLSFDHPYPPTKLLFHPSPLPPGTSLLPLATSSAFGKSRTLRLTLFLRSTIVKLVNILLH